MRGAATAIATVFLLVALGLVWLATTLLEMVRWVLQ